MYRIWRHAIGGNKFPISSRSLGRSLGYHCKSSAKTNLFNARALNCFRFAVHCISRCRLGREGGVHFYCSMGLLIPRPTLIALSPRRHADEIPTGATYELWNLSSALAEPSLSITVADPIPLPLNQPVQMPWIETYRCINSRMQMVYTPTPACSAFLFILWHNYLINDCTFCYNLFFLK